MRSEIAIVFVLIGIVAFNLHFSPVVGDVIRSELLRSRDRIGWWKGVWRIVPTGFRSAGGRFLAQKGVE